MGYSCGFATETLSQSAGIVKMKQLARSYVWWPDIDSQVEEVTKSC